MQPAITLLQTNHAIMLCVMLWFGLNIGSFLNVVIYRLPVMYQRKKSGIRYAEPYNLAWPGSACPKCGHKISTLENIPVISYLCLGGKCRGCKASISKRYPTIELITGLLTVYVFHLQGFTFHALSRCAVLYLMLVVMMICYDHEYQTE